MLGVHSIDDKKIGSEPQAMIVGREERDMLDEETSEVSEDTQRHSSSSPIGANRGDTLSELSGDDVHGRTLCLILFLG